MRFCKCVCVVRFFFLYISRTSGYVYTANSGCKYNLQNTQRTLWWKSNLESDKVLDLICDNLMFATRDKWT